MLRTITLLPERRPLQLELWEAAPDVMVGDKPGNVRPPRHGIVIWEPVGDGHNWRPMIETHPALVPLKQWDSKLYGCPRLVIQALVEGGFVEGERISPRCLNINLESWMQHRAMVRSNPWFWRDMDNLRRYTTALHAVNSQGKRGKLKSCRSDAPAPLSAVKTLKTSKGVRRGAASEGSSQSGAESKSQKSA